LQTSTIGRQRAVACNPAQQIKKWQIDAALVS
jgi:hypothetical protein